MNYHKIEKHSIANGFGIRVVLWASGCSLHCKGCQNPSTWDFSSGRLFGRDAEKELLEALKQPYIKGITFSGGHPLECSNAPCIYELIQKIKTQLPEKDIWLYTGLQLSIKDFQVSDQLINNILRLCDVVVDGPYIEAQKDITLKFRGSKNQRLIDVKETLKQNQIITLQND